MSLHVTGAGCRRWVSWPATDAARDARDLGSVLDWLAAADGEKTTTLKRAGDLACRFAAKALKGAVVQLTASAVRQ
jgi:hypothetical protein